MKWKLLTKQSRNKKESTLIALVKPSEKTKQKLGLSDEWRYEIRLENGKITCDCPYISFGNKNDDITKECKHIKKFQSILENQ